MIALVGSILALKVLTGRNTKVILKNMDNKCLENEGKTVSSSYPPRSLSNGQNPGNADKCKALIRMVGRNQ